MSSYDFLTMVICIILGISGRQAYFLVQDLHDRWNRR